MEKSSNEYIAIGWPDIQKYMESPRWDEVGFDANKNVWFVPKDMVNTEDSLPKEGQKTVRVYGAATGKFAQVIQKQ